VLEFKGIKGYTRVANGPIIATPDPPSNKDQATFKDFTESASMYEDNEYNIAPETSTSMSLEEGAQKSFDRLWEHFSFLDPEYMLDRDYGEVFFDLAVGFHPIDPGVVGIWRLQNLEASFGAAGYKSGTAHPLNTMWEVGGLMSEMLKRNREASHVVYQVAYNTTYEAVRKKDNQVNIFDLLDVIKMTPKFSQDYNAVQNIFHLAANSNRSWGVRREFRIGGDALESVFPLLDGEASFYLQFYFHYPAHMTAYQARAVAQSNSIAWFPARTWFKSNSYRLEGLRDLLRQLRQKEIGNLGHIGGIISHMLQSVTSTCTHVESFVYQDLRHLLYGPHIRRFNMFFLDSLDLKKQNVLWEAGIPAQDESFIVRQLGTALIASPHHDGRAAGEQQGDAAFPLGQIAAWAQVKDMVDKNPHKIIQKYAWPPSLDIFLDPAPEDPIRGEAVRLFIMLTQSLWCLLTDPYKLDLTQKINLDTIQDVVHFWSLSSMLAVLHRPYLQAINTEDIGASGRHRATFGSNEQVNLFFRTRDRRGWRCLDMTVGKTYDEIICAYPGASNEARLCKYLGELLAVCQFLPDSSLAHVWSYDKQGRVTINSNPRYWKVDRITREGTQNRSQRRSTANKGARDFVADILRFRNPDITATEVNAAYREWNSTQHTTKKPSGSRSKRKKTVLLRSPNSEDEQTPVARPRCSNAKKARLQSEGAATDSEPESASDWSPGDDEPEDSN
jgi:hypothetical protein